MKTKITKNSKIALLALIFFSPVFFSLVGGNNLQAQEQKSSKTTGWFVGINPFSPSIELETKHSESYTNFTRITETVSGDIQTRRESTVNSNITSTSDLRVEYEINILAFNERAAPATIQDKIDSVEAAKIACSDDVDYNVGRIYKDFYFSVGNGPVFDSGSNQIFCGLPSDATAIVKFRGQAQDPYMFFLLVFFCLFFFACFFLLVFFCLFFSACFFLLVFFCLFFFGG